MRELRDLFKFEFFYPDTQEFEQQIDAELCRDEPRWQSLLSERPDNARLIINRLSPKLGHVALTIFAEAYSVGLDILLRQPDDEPLDEAVFIDRCTATVDRHTCSDVSVARPQSGNCSMAMRGRC